MAKFIRRRVKVGIGKEGTRGLGAAATYILPFSEFSFDEKVVEARSAEAFGHISDSLEKYVVEKYAEGPLNGEVRDKSFGLLLLAALGSVSTAGPTDSAYTHSFSVANTNQHQSLGLTVYSPIDTVKFNLAMLNSLQIIVEPENIVAFNATFMSKKHTDSSGTASEVTAENKFTKKHVSVKVAAVVGDLAAASALSIKRLTLTISKNVIRDSILGTPDPEDILNRHLSIEGELELNEEDRTWRDYMTNGTEKALEIFLNNTDKTIGAGAVNPSLKIQLSKVDFYGWEPTGGADDVAQQRISFKANYDITTSTVVYLCQLVNGAISY